MADDTKQNATPSGVGPGVTGGSGDLVEGSGHGHGIGGTGHDNDAAASGMRPDERNLPTQQDAMGGSPTGEVTPVRKSGRGTVGGGGAERVPAPATTTPGHADGGSGADGSVPGGTRNVGPADDLEPGGQDVHRSPRDRG